MIGMFDVTIDAIAVIDFTGIAMVGAMIGAITVGIGIGVVGTGGFGRIKLIALFGDQLQCAAEAQAVSNAL